MEETEGASAPRAAVGAPSETILPARLVVLSSEARGRELRAVLEGIGMAPEQVRAVCSLGATRELIAAEPPDAVLVDFSIGAAEAVQAVAELATERPKLPMVVSMPRGAAPDLGFQALAAGADDLVLDGSDGCSLSSALLRATRRRVHPGRSAPEGDVELAAMLDCIDEPACLIDASGVIVVTNRVWRSVADAAAADPDKVGSGVSYLSICEQATGTHSEGAAEALAGIRAVLSGEATRFSLEYPCPCTGSERWFVLRVTPFTERGGALVVHRDITALKLAERRAELGAEWAHRMLDEDYPVFALVDADGVITHVSPSTIELLGRRASTIGHSAFFSVDKRQRKEALDVFRRVVAEPGSCEHLLVHVVDGAGRVRELDLEVRNRLDDPLVGAVSVVGSDVTEARRQQIARHLESRLLQRLPVAVCVTDEHDAVVYWNAEAARLFRHPAEEMSGRHISDVGVWPPDLVSPDDGLRFDAQRWEGEYDARRADGTSVPVRTMLERIDDDEIDFHGVVGASVDISERRELERELAYRALHDPLTGLPNRVLFLEHLDRALKRDARTGRQTAVLFADLDDFKSVNDRLGHGHGDAVLRSSAQRIATVVRAGDVVARLGGDEFAICCEDLADRAEAVNVAQRIVDAFKMPDPPAAVPGDGSGRDPASWGGRSPSISVSIGVAVARTDSEPETLLRHADVAMYEAKERGKARIEVFDEALHARPRQHDGIAGDLGSAVAAGGIEVVYQPVHVVGTGSLFGFEAYARWTHPEWGPVAPGEFIRAAELAGTIGELGVRVLATSCEALAALLGADAPPLRMTVNVSALQLADPSFAETVREVLQSSGVPAGLVCLEVKESALADGEVARRALTDVKALGVETSVDDVGTEYSSLSRLQQFPVDYLKIDRSFVSGMTYRAVDAAIVDALLGLARSLGIRAVAKGVEDHVQLAALRAAGCELGQGYYWSKPLALADAAELVAQERQREVEHRR